MELLDTSLPILLSLFITAAIAGMLDTLAGGGGLITVPALLLTGIPPIYALGTNKLQGCVGTGTATLVLLGKRKIHWQQIRVYMAAAFIGAATGTLLVQTIPAQTLDFVIPCVLVGIAIYFLLYRPPTELNSKPQMTEATYLKTIVPGIGFYDGMFGPGTGSFFSASAMLLRAKTIIEATSLAKPMNFAANCASLLVFLLAGKVIWIYGVTMLVGQMLGAWLGAHTLYKIAPRYLRYLVILMSATMLIRYGYTHAWFCFS